MFDHPASDSINPVVLSVAIQPAGEQPFTDSAEMRVVPAEARTNLMNGDLVEINRPSVNGRAWMSTVAPVKRVLAQGTRAELLSDPTRADGKIWVRLRLADDAPGDSCFVAARYLDLVEARGSVPLTVVRPSIDPDKDALPYRRGDFVQTTVKVKLRQSPGTQSAILRELASNTVATVLSGSERVGDPEWVQVELSGIRGWLAIKYTRLFARGERWLEVDISGQTLIAWNDRAEDARMTISSGKPGFRTPLGTFTILSKTPARRTRATVNGEHWDIPGVPWVMVFRSGGYYVHGVYWHNDFGAPVSHGCVTLGVSDAEWIYEWTPLGAPVWIHE